MHKKTIAIKQEIQKLQSYENRVVNNQKEILNKVHTINGFQDTVWGRIFY